MQGIRFGRLIVLNNIQGSEWLCQCDCGDKKIAKTWWLKKGSVKSCGCYRKSFKKTHGRNLDPVYKMWNQMKQRCQNKNHPYYSYYGAKGIQVCERWQKFESFIEDMGERPSSKHTIERVNGNVGYSKENCRWATRMEQSQNLSSNRNFTWRGKTQSLSAWARETGISWKTLQYRLNANWSLDVAMTLKPIRHSK